MKILIFTDLFYPFVGGLESYTYILGKELVKKNFEVFVLTSGLEGAEKFEEKEGMKIIRVGRFGKSNQLALISKELERICDDYKIDLIHSHHYPSILPTLSLKGKKDIPKIFTCHACFGDFSQDEKYKYLENLLITQAFDIFDKVTCVSNYVKEYLIEKGGVSSKTEVIYGCVDGNLFHKKKVEKEYDILIPNCFDPWKGPLIALKLFEYLGGKYKFAFLGSNTKLKLRNKTYQALKKKSQNSKNLEIINSSIALEDMPEVYSKSKIVIVPSLSEALGLVSLEAQACEVPVVVNNLGGLPETIIEGKTGLFIDQFDLEKTAREIDELLKDEKMMKKFGLNGRENVLKNFSKEIMVEKIIKGYENALKK